MKEVAILFLLIVYSGNCLAQQDDTARSRTDRQLQAVTVRARAPLIRQEADRIVYDLQSDAQSKGSSVLDMMRKVPYLSVDADENILLNGSPAYKVFINGRPSGLLATDPRAALRGMPASTVKSIEVITNPPARYDAEGLAGIINIITIRQAFDGYKGSMNISEKGPAGGPGAGGSFSIRQGRFGISSLAGVSGFRIPGTEAGLSQTTDGAGPLSLHQHSSGSSSSLTSYTGLELSYEQDSLDLLTAQLNWNGERSTGMAEQTTALIRESYRQEHSLNRNDSKLSRGLEADMNYQRSSRADKDRLLTFSYRYFTDHDNSNNNVSISARLNDTTPDYRQRHSEVLEEHTLQLDYVRPAKFLVIEGGLKGVFRTSRTEFNYDELDIVTGQYETDPAYSNVFSNARNILSAYNSYAYQSAGWQVKAGIRTEETMIRLHYDSGSPVKRQNYLTILPSIVVGRRFQEHGSLSLSFTQRIQRPSAAESDPFVNRSDPNFPSSGNPDLKPIHSDVYQLSYTRSGKLDLNVALCGMFFKDVFSPFPLYDSVTNITLTRNENYGKGRVLKLNVFLSYPIVPGLSFTVNGDIRHVAVYGVTNGISVKNSGLDVYVYASGEYSFRRLWRFNADLTYKKGGLLLPLGRTSGFTASSFGISREFSRCGLTASAAVSNPFTRYRYVNQTITGSGFFEESISRSYYRRFSVSLNYSFGRLKDEIRKSKRGISDDGAGH